MWSTKMWAFYPAGRVLIAAESLGGDCDTLATLGVDEQVTFCCRSGAVDRYQGGAIIRVAGTGRQAIAPEDMNRCHSINTRGDTITFGCAAGRWACVGTSPNVECICES